MDFAQALAVLNHRLPSFEKQGEKALRRGLERVRQLLDGLGGIEVLDQRVIHIGGTNGKGSVAHSLASVLQAQGYKVGLHTSPHVSSVCERARINGQPIPENTFADYLSRTLSLWKTLNPSYFELCTAISLAFFAQEKVDIALVEVGLGGRWDATNVVCPRLSILTSVSRDHEHILGPELKDIAYEKAGIIKENVPLIVGELPKEALSIVQQEAQQKRVPMYTCEDFAVGRVEEHAQHRKVWIGEQGYEVDILGDHYLKNLPIVLKSLAVLNERTPGFAPPEALHVGLRAVQSRTGLQGRWQHFAPNHVTAVPKLIFDMAHNEAGWQEVFAQLEKMKKRHLFMVLGLSSDKNRRMLWQHCPKHARYFFVESNTPRTVPKDILHQEAQAAGLKADAAGKLRDVMAQVLSMSQAEDAIFIGGSLYLLSEVEEVLAEHNLFPHANNTSNVPLT